MRKSLSIFILTIALFIGILSTPAMAYDNQAYKNQVSTRNSYRIIPNHREGFFGMFNRYNSPYVYFYNPTIQPKPVDPVPSPEVKPEEPAPQPNPEEPVPQPKPQEPAPQPQPEKPAPQPSPEPTPAPQGVAGQQGQMLDMVNQERVKAGLKPLVWDASLANVAQVKAKDMTDNNYFDHSSPTYGSPFEMMKKFGISYRAAGENLAGSGSVERAHVGLMNSEGHRKNILNPNFTHLGIGVEKSTRYGYVYVQMFVGR